MIGIFSFFDPAEKSLVIGIPDGTETTFIRWINDDNVLVGLHGLLSVEAGERWYISRLIGINRLTGKVTKLLFDSGGQDAADVIWKPSDGSSKVLVAAQYTIYTNYPDLFWPSVYEVDVVTGKKKTVLKGREGVMYWDADAQGTIRTGYRYADSGRKFSLLYRGEGSSGTFRQIDRADTRKQEALLRPFLFLPGTDRGLVQHDDDKGRAGIYEVDLLTREDVRTVYAAPEGTEIEGIAMSADGLTMLGVYTSAADGGVHWFDTQLAELQAQFNKAVGTRRARIVSFNRDRSRMLVVVDRADTPGSLYFYSVQDGALRRVADMNSVIGSRYLSPVRSVRYKARDGLDIEAILTLPKGMEARNLPIVMMPHGGPWAQDTLNYDYWAQFVASRGYAVLQPNFRGSTGYGDEFKRKGEGQMGFAMQDDITDGLRWAVAQGIADPARACIVGASYGGYAAMWGLIKDPDQYRCAISIAGVASLRREVNDMGDSLTGGLSKDAWQRMTPDFAAVSPINAVPRMKAPLLLIHGKKDVTVDHGQSSSMHSRMLAAGKQVEFLSLPEADHYFTRQEDRQALLAAIEVFLARHNPAGAKR
jgi:dipeptidyl aminopeptidase/acylaminoacyl peptidase